jgi:hypothetical protein
MTRPGHDDEVVTTVSDHEAARPVVEALLLAGLGPNVRPTADGVEITVVRGDGGRARRALGIPDPVTPEGGASSASGPPAAWSEGEGVTPGAAAARAAALGAPVGEGSTPPSAGSDAAPATLTPGPGGADPTRRRTTVIYLAVFLLALVVVPAVAFFLSFKAAGG